MSAPGHKRPFASVEPHASFTFANRHSPEQQVAALGPLLIDVGSLSVYEKFRDGRVAIAHPSPRDGCGMVDGRNGPGRLPLH
jgi:hypothetical protein